VAAALLPGRVVDSGESAAARVRPGLAEVLTLWLLLPLGESSATRLRASAVVGVISATVRQHESNIAAKFLVQL
jgi:hypothetical protein